MASTLLGLLACGKSDGGTPQAQLKVTFDGKTTVYTNVTMSEGRLGPLSGLEISAKGAGNEYLSLFVYGTTAGTYPYRQDVNTYAQTSQVEYKTAGTVFSNYKARVCPTTSGYYSSTGQVVLDFYSANQVAKGTFSGTLLDQNDEDMCTTDGIPFSGEFFVTKD